jgi:2'-5' RNA ligase
MAASFGIFVLAELPGEAGAAVREIQQRFDPKLARMTPPHVTLVGSSGVGAIPSDTPLERIREALAPVAAETEPMVLPFGAPHRFMQTDIISLPLDPHGPLRTLHERLARSGLRFKPSRFVFSPHCTLNFYPTLTPQTERELLSLRVTAPAIINTLQIYLTRDPQPSKLLFELPLGGAAARSEKPGASEETPGRTVRDSGSQGAASGTRRSPA